MIEFKLIEIMLFVLKFVEVINIVDFDVLMLLNNFVFVFV